MLVPTALNAPQETLGTLEAETGANDWQLEPSQLKEVDSAWEEYERDPSTAITPAELQVKIQSWYDASVAAR